MKFLFFFLVFPFCSFTLGIKFRKSLLLLESVLFPSKIFLSLLVAMSLFLLMFLLYSSITVMPFLLILLMLNTSSAQTFGLLWKCICVSFPMCSFREVSPLRLSLSELHFEAWLLLLLSFPLASGDESGEGGKLRLCFFFSDVGRFPAPQSTPFNWVCALFLRPWDQTSGLHVMPWNSCFH